MRLWHYKLLPVLPDKFIIAEWRECIAIKRQWEKGILKHRLVSYVMDYDRRYFGNYVIDITHEMYKRNIKFQDKFLAEILDFCTEHNWMINTGNYPEHNDRYLKQCYYNLQEKYDRGIITEEEYNEILNTVTVCLNSSVQQIKELL